MTPSVHFGTRVSILRRDSRQSCGEKGCTLFGSERGGPVTPIAVERDRPATPELDIDIAIPTVRAGNPLSDGWLFFAHITRTFLLRTHRRGSHRSDIGCRPASPDGRITRSRTLRGTAVLCRTDGNTVPPVTPFANDSISRFRGSFGRSLVGLKLVIHHRRPSRFRQRPRTDRPGHSVRGSGRRRRTRRRPRR